MEKKEIIFGRNPVLEYIKNTQDSKGIELFISKNAHGKIIDIIANEARAKGIRIEFCEKEKLLKHHPSSRHQGVILLTSSKRDSKNDQDFIRQVSENRGVLVLLDQLNDPHNIGSIIRTVEALGGNGVILPKSNSPKISGTIAKVSAGATAYLRIITVPNIAGFLDQCRESGFWIIGTADDGTSSLEKLKELRPSVIIVGSEGKGMRRLTREKCDYIFKIPLKGNVSSLNASVAAGIVLYEALK